jgi:hypothetical protein
LLYPGNEDVVWKRVYSLCLKVESIEVDKQLLSSLREIRGILTGETLDNACVHVKFMLNSLLLQAPQQTGSAGKPTNRQSSGSPIEAADNENSNPPLMPSSPSAMASSSTSISTTVNIFNRSGMRRLLEGTRLVEL